MSALHPFFRLLWRPMMLLMLFPLYWAVLLPFLSLPEREAAAAFDALSRGAGGVTVTQVLLHAGVTVAAALGLAAALASLELQHARFAWDLPDVRRRLAMGLVTFALSGGLGLAALLVWNGGGALAAAGLALFVFWFAAAVVIVDPAQRGILRWVLFALLIVAAARPAIYTAFVAAAPWVLPAIAAGGAGALLREVMSRERARRRPFIESQFVSGRYATRLYWAGVPHVERSWSTSLAAAAWKDWLSAAAYETSGAFRTGWRRVLLGYALFAAVAYVVSPSLILMVFGIPLTFSGIQLRAGVHYPISRRTRAQVQYAGNLADLLIMLAVVGTVLTVLHAAGAPRIATAQDTRVGWPMLLGLGVALAPVAQWARATRPLTAGDQNRFGRHFIFIIVYAVLAVGGVAVFAQLLPLESAATRAAVVVTLALIVQATHRAALNRAYARADLVPAR